MNRKTKSLVVASAIAGCLAGFSGTTLAKNTNSHSEYLSDFLDHYWSGNNLHPWECKHIRWASPLRLPRCMQSENVMEHLYMFQAIADANNGTRASGLPGYEDSVTYIKENLESMGYDVTLDKFDFNAFYENADGVLSATAPSPVSYEWDVDFRYMSQTEAGDVTGPVVAVDLDLGPDNASSSGCEIEDFAGFPAGAIALVQRGACTFQSKAENAAASGAVGTIIFNQGNSDDRKGLISGTLGANYAGGIPVFFATYDNGVAWSSTEGIEMNMVADVLREVRSVDNVIAETNKGADDNIIMLGAHLDSVFEGPGVQDNGSGSAALLEMASLIKKAKVKNKIRFAWWGAEESGLVGSTDYVNRLTDEELAKIKVYLNYDMIASPNYFFGIYDGDGSDFELEGPPGSKATEELFETYYDLRGQVFEGSEISFRSDYAQFFLRDKAFGGLFTGAEVIKTEEQAEKYGGEAGIAFDPCYHQACDTIENISDRALEVNSDAVAFMVGVLANTTYMIDEEIAAAEQEPEPVAKALSLNAASASAAASAAAYDITHWGKYWIK